MSTARGYFYEFEQYQLDPDQRALKRGGLTLTLTPKALDVLIVLVEYSRQIISKTELLARCWPAGDEGGGQLAQHVSTLRKILGERESGGQFIETVARQGYRFVAAVSRCARLTPAGPADPPLPPAAPLPSSDTRLLTPVAFSDAGNAPRMPSAPSGRYQFLSLLGAGGMGEVFLARDTQLDRQVALKLLSQKYTRNAEWLRRFVREAKAASALNHPNIITIHEIGEVDGIHYIATEHIEGKTLRMQMLNGAMETTLAVNLATQVAGALSAAHAAGIIHRDIKPENIMVRPDGYVKLLDFGLAKPLADNAEGGFRFETDPGTIMGTTHYMSPEQARGLPVDGRSDVFSLGVLLFEMLAGRPPFSGKTGGDVLVAILDRPPPLLSTTLPDTPPELERIVGKALRKNREQRYQTIKDFHLDLKSLQQALEMRSHLADSRLRESTVKAADVVSPTRSASSRGVSAHSNSDAEARFEIPEVHYARSGEVNIAYQVIGNAPMDLVFVMGWISHLEYFWTEPSFARFLRRLATFARVILFDKRGTGLSDRVPLDQLPTLEQRMDDVRAVMDAVGSKHAVLCGVSEGGPMCSLFAATYPDKTIALVMMGSYARRLRGEGYPWGPSEADRDLFLEEIRNHWGGPVGLEDRAPSVANDPTFRNWWATYLRRGASPGAAVALTRMNTEIDIRHVLPMVRVPTLVVHRSGDLCLKVQEGRYLAEHIPGAKFVELPGIDHLPFVGEQNEILDEIEEFLTGVRHASDFDRVLATVLVVRVVEPFDDGQVDQQSGLLSQHRLFFRREVELFKGRVIEISDDGLLATFDGPARAIRAAYAIRASAQRFGIALQCGLHTGECDVLGDRVGGPAVEIARQVAAQSPVGEVLVSSTVRDLVAGSGIEFLECGSLLLTAQLGEWRLFAA